MLFTRPLRHAAQGAAALAVVAGSVGVAHYDKAVEVSVDGQPTSVHVMGSTVADVLDKQDIAVGPHDVVVPTLGSAVSDGDHISVRYGRKLTVTVDGQTKEYWTTATTVDTALKDLGIRADGAVLSASRSQPLGRGGLTLAVTTPKKVTFVADGKTRTVTSTSSTVFGLLAELGVTKKVDDVVSPAMPTALDDGMKVVLKRVVIKKVQHDAARRLRHDQAEGRLALQGADQGRQGRQEGQPGRRPAEDLGRRQAHQDHAGLAEGHQEAGGRRRQGRHQGASGGEAGVLVVLGRPQLREQLGSRAEPRPLRHVGPHRPVRVRRPLEHQHR